MKIIINVLIVDDSPSSQGITKRGIRKFNAQSPDFELIVVGETLSSEEGIEIIQKTPNPIHLIFLDYNLLVKNGFFLSRQFPNLLYLVVSTDPQITKFIAEEKRCYHHPYMEHITEGGYIFDSDDIVAAIKKCFETYKTQ